MIYDQNQYDFVRIAGTDHYLRRISNKYLVTSSEKRLCRNLEGVLFY